MASGVWYRWRGKAWAMMSERQALHVKNKPCYFPYWLVVTEAMVTTLYHRLLRSHDTTPPPSRTSLSSRGYTTKPVRAPDLRDFIGRTLRRCMIGQAGLEVIGRDWIFSQDLESYRLRYLLRDGHIHECHLTKSRKSSSSPAESSVKRRHPVVQLGRQIICSTI